MNFIQLLEQKQHTATGWKKKQENPIVYEYSWGDWQNVKHAILTKFLLF